MSKPESTEPRLETSETSSDDERAGWSTVGAELQQQDPETFEELRGIARDILNSLRARDARRARVSRDLFGPRKVKPQA